LQNPSSSGEAIAERLAKAISWITLGIAVLCVVPGLVMLIRMPSAGGYVAIIFGLVISGLVWGFGRVCFWVLTGRWR
jgi:hypothetical protein